MQKLTNHPRSAYVHVPFCHRRCGYCNFTLVASRDDLIDRYLDALEIELSLLGLPRLMQTIFIGGGTPTLLPEKPLQRLLDLLARWLPLEVGGEWSCEANPLDCNRVKLELLRAAGVNRLSIGGQSFDDRKLQSLERDHTGDELTRAIDVAGSHFDNVSLDLIFAAPDESFAQWQSDVRRALASGVQHLSTYGLTVEKGSAFFGRVKRGKLQEIGEEMQLAMYSYVIDEATKWGWEHYEVSSFSRLGLFCRHNEVYWSGRPWLAFGPGAASFDGHVRQVNHRSTTTYIRKMLAHESAVAERDELTAEQCVREQFVFGLRRMRGIELGDLSTDEFPDPEELFQPQLDRYVQSGWLSRSGQRITLTRSGLMISDSLWPAFLRHT